jgi:hypothetical protein
MMVAFAYFGCRTIPPLHSRRMDAPVGSNWMRMLLVWCVCGLLKKVDKAAADNPFAVFYS